jgi:hypothetical protein
MKKLKVMKYVFSTLLVDAKTGRGGIAGTIGALTWVVFGLIGYVPIKPHWARVVGYGSFSLCVIHKKGLCHRSGDINRLMMMMMRVCTKHVV